MRYVTPQTLQTGVINFIAQDMLPKVDGWKKVAFGTALTLSCDQDLVSQFMSNPAISMLGIVTQDGRIDIERLKNAVEQQIGNQRMDVTIPLVGTFKIGQPDIERLYQIILRMEEGEG